MENSSYAEDGQPGETRRCDRPRTRPASDGEPPKHPESDNRQHIEQQKRDDQSRPRLSLLEPPFVGARKSLWVSKGRYLLQEAMTDAQKIPKNTRNASLDEAFTVSAIHLGVVKALSTTLSVGLMRTDVSQGEYCVPARYDVSGRSGVRERAVNSVILDTSPESRLDGCIDLDIRQRKLKQSLPFWAGPSPTTRRSSTTRTRCREPCRCNASPFEQPPCRFA